MGCVGTHRSKSSLAMPQLGERGERGGGGGEGDGEMGKRLVERGCGSLGPAGAEQCGTYRSGSQLHSLLIL